MDVRLVYSPSREETIKSNAAVSPFSKILSVERSPWEVREAAEHQIGPKSQPRLPSLTACRVLYEPLRSWQSPQPNSREIPATAVRRSTAVHDVIVHGASPMVKRTIMPKTKRASLQLSASEHKEFPIIAVASYSDPSSVLNG